MRKFWGSLAHTAAAAALVGGALWAGEGAGGPGQALDATRAALAKWLETQQIMAREKKDWRTEKEISQERAALLRKEIEVLEEKILHLRQSLSDVGDRRRQIEEQNDILRSASAALGEAIAPLEARTRALLARLPEPLLARVRPLSQRLPADAGGAKASLGERYQSVIGILNEVSKFNREITVASEVRALPGGASAEVKALYLGLGQAYYVTARGDGAGVGRPAAEGWAWQQADHLAGDIAHAVSILQSEKPPAYVPLPVQLR